MIISDHIWVSYLRDLTLLLCVQSCHHTVDGVKNPVPPPQCYYLGDQRRAFTLSPPIRQNHVQQRPTKRIRQRRKSYIQCEQ